MKELSENPVLVIRRKLAGAKARLILENGYVLDVGRYSPIGKGDQVCRTNNITSVVLPNSQQRIQLMPVWEMHHNVNIGDESLLVILKEIETDEELVGYKNLTQYHYRGSKGVGRSVPLIATVSSDKLPKVIGFIEITSALLTNSARRSLFDANFSDPRSGIAWVGWNGKATKNFSNSIARISRCVVFPELRGIGLSKKLCHAAIDYCKSRWYIAGRKPLFLEITADMLRYYPFVKSSGFEYIGDTAGNADRLTKDMQYLLRKYASKGRKGLPKGGGGIMSLQISNTETLRQMMESSGKNLNQVIDILKKAPDKLSDDEWIALHKVYRRPKPTYIIGLNENTRKFIAKRKRNTGIKEPALTFGLYEQPRNTKHWKISLKRLSISSELSNSARSRAVQESFGFVSRGLTTDVSSAFNLQITTGDVILISGPSGSGKSILIKCLIKLLSSNVNRLSKKISLGS